ncbi:hypothetical protein ACTWP5_13770 [Streptomyces sp. 4N509B]|uniref:hypothetical protein n=1 Tax=Streptomyces sp. 4N509B TaxID=3457413 RepID=UPI003FD561E7
MNALKLKFDGAKVAAESKKNAFVNTCSYAVDLGKLSENPVSGGKNCQKPGS